MEWHRPQVFLLLERKERRSCRYSATGHLPLATMAPTNQKTGMIHKSTEETQIRTLIRKERRETADAFSGRICARPQIVGG